MTRYWFTTCRLCNHQGRLFIERNLASNKLYLHCEECESAWYEPSNIDDFKERFFHFDADFDSEFASIADIELAGWRKYALNETDEES